MQFLRRNFPFSAWVQSLIGDVTLVDAGARRHSLFLLGKFVGTKKCSSMRARPKKQGGRLGLQEFSCCEYVPRGRHP
jgi:hypothetical protein